MAVRFHPHALERLAERGTNDAEVVETVQTGEQFSAKFGRTRFRKTFLFESTWQGHFYRMKEVEAIVVREDETWLVITVLTRYY